MSPPYPEIYVLPISLVVLGLVPWLLGLWRVWRAWGRASGLDGPERLLTAAVATLPAERRSWGEALLAELAHLGERGERRRFALGGVRTVLLTPRGDQRPVLVAAAVALGATAVAWLVTSLALPGLGLFAVVLVGLLGLALTSQVARATPTGVRSIPALAGVLVCVGITVYLLVTEPTAAIALEWDEELLFAALLAGCAWLGLRSAKDDRPARWYGYGAAAVVAALLVLETIRVTGAQDGIWGFLMWAPPVTLFACGFLAARAGRSLRSGVLSVLWATGTGIPAMFAIGVFASLHVGETYGILLFDGEAVPDLPLGMGLSETIWMLLALPLWGLPFGLLGAVWGHRRTAIARHTQAP